MRQPAASRLPAYALFAAMLSTAGLPIYIHAPKFYVDTYGVSLSALGAVLFGLRLLDVVQDPLLGRLAEALRHRRSLAVMLAAGLMAIAMLGLFAVDPMLPPLVWFGLTLALVFTGFSFLTICFYAQGVAKAERLISGHLTLARWRETGALLGVCAASVAPVVLGLWFARPFAGFAVGFAVLTAGAVWTMRREWVATDETAPVGFAAILRDPPARRLLLIALFNAAPVAVSSTLFLFFVESALAAPGWEGPLLLLFFLSAAVAAPGWSLIAERVGSRPALLSAMILAITAFAGALFLGPGDVAWFALICILSGAAVGADLTILPAMFARRMAVIAPTGAEGFGLWSFVSKVALAFAAVVLLHTLERAGFRSGDAPNPDMALNVLTWLYAGVPCVLKLCAIWLLIRADTMEDQ